MDVFFSPSEANRLAASSGNQIELADGVILGIGIGVGTLPCFRFSIGEKRDPFAVRRPSGFGIMAGLRKLDQGLGVIPVQP